MQLTTVDIGFFALLAAMVAVVAILAHALWKSNRMLMWFHHAGRGLAETELRRAELDVRAKEAEANKAAADAQRAHAEMKSQESTSRFGANGRRDVLT